MSSPSIVGHELRQGVELRLRLAPVVVRPPVAHELLEFRELHALRPIGDRLPVGPSRGGDAPAEIDECSSGTLMRKGRIGVAARPQRPVATGAGSRQCATAMPIVRAWPQKPAAIAGRLSAVIRSYPRCVSESEKVASWRGSGGAQAARADALQIDLRSDLNAARSSAAKSCGCFPGREVAALVELVVMDELGIRPLCPAPRGLILLARKDAHGHRDGDALGVEEAALVLPIETRRRDPRVRQPIERDVVEDLVTRQFARGARGPVQSRGDRRCRLAVSIIVVEEPGGQADG